MCHRKIDSLINTKIQILLISVFFILISAVSASARTVTLAWDDNSEPDLDHYVVYWGFNPGDYVYNSIDNGDDIGLGTEYSVDIPDDDQIYFFAVTAVDVSGLESDFSNEVNTNDNPSIVILPVNSNWNLISIAGGNEIVSVEDALAPIMTDVISVWTYDNGSWLVYDPENPDFSDLLDVEPGQGMWVNMRGNSQLTIPGESPAYGVDLFDGWNLVGFSSPASQNISDAISSIDGDVVSVWAYQNGEWKSYDPQDTASSALTTMDPGYGYWINTTEACTWTLP
jgi:hypothetical protein